MDEDSFSIFKRLFSKCIPKFDRYDVWNLQYGNIKYHLDALKVILEWRGVPKKSGKEGTLLKYVQSKVDYDSVYFVKFFLLLVAYEQEDYGVRMNPNLDITMFEETESYTGANFSKERLKLTTAISKDIHQFDFCIEMLEKVPNYYGCWRMDIFERKSKIEVAVYGG